MTALETVVWTWSLICVTAGHLSLKAGARGGVAPDAPVLERWKTMIKGFWVGWCPAFAAEFLLWLAFLSLVPLSLAVSVGSIDRLAVSVGGRIAFAKPSPCAGRGASS